MTQANRKRRPTQEQRANRTRRPRNKQTGVSKTQRNSEHKSSRPATGPTEDRPHANSRATAKELARKRSHARDERQSKKRVQDQNRNQARIEQRRRTAGRSTNAHRRSQTPKQSPRARTLGSYRRIGVIATAVLLACASFVGLLFFARPSVSKVENRALTAFPALSWESFWNGKFFSDVALWYSDTYPLREQMVSADQALNGLHGLKTETQMVGGTKQADELPPVGGSSNNNDSSGESEKKEKKRENVEVPTEQEMAAAVQNQITDGLYVKGDAAYNIYYFSQEAVDAYADAINTLSSELDGQATVYSIVVPNSSGVMLSDQEVKDIGGTNQVDALNYFYSKYDKSVRDVDVMGLLREHNDEYLYYRTDHHWSTLGSYYGYEAFCKEKGIEAENRDDMKYKNMGDYLGSFYSQLNSEAMAANPDYMDAWYPNATNELTIYYNDGTTEKCDIVTDTSSADAFGKGLTHIMGDQPLEKITNPKLSDGSSCLVIKDSFGDSFAPWLVDNYETVWIADFRYFEGSYTDLVKENDIKDVIVLNNISLAGGGVVAPAILGKL